MLCFYFTFKILSVGFWKGEKVNIGVKLTFFPRNRLLFSMKVFFSLPGPVVASLVQESLTFAGHLEAQGGCRQYLGSLWIPGTEQGLPAVQSEGITSHIRCSQCSLLPPASALVPLSHWYGLDICELRFCVEINWHVPRGENKTPVRSASSVAGSHFGRETPVFSVDAAKSFLL